jgi:hypothetical protein
LGSQSAGVGAYAVLNRQFYVEASVYRVATGFFRWMSAGVAFQAGDQTYLSGYNPYWRAYWERSRGPQSFMIGTFGLKANVYPDSSNPHGPTDAFTDYGFDSQYQYLASTHKVTLRANYVFERRNWDASLPLGTVGTSKGNLRFLNPSATYTYDNTWSFNAGYSFADGNTDSTLYPITNASGDLISSSPKTTGYTLQVDRHLTQNIDLMAQYSGFFRFNGLRHNVDGNGRSASDNNSLWLSVFFAF